MQHCDGKVQFFVCCRLWDEETRLFTPTREHFSNPLPRPILVGKFSISLLSKNKTELSVGRFDSLADPPALIDSLITLPIELKDSDLFIVPEQAPYLHTGPIRATSIDPLMEHQGHTDYLPAFCYVCFPVHLCRYVDLNWVVTGQIDCVHLQ